MTEEFQSICYSHHTKDSVTQSMSTHGAIHSYKILLDFLDVIGKDVVVSNASVSAGFMEKSRAGKKSAKSLVRQLETKYGKSSKIKVLHEFSFAVHYEAFPDWNIKTSDLQSALQYVDELGSLVEFVYRPPVQVVVRFEFYLVANTDSIHSSHIMAFFSPNSNSIGVHLVLPFIDNDKRFIEFKTVLVKSSPIPILDKYFYIKSTSKSNKEYYRHLYS